MTSSTLGTFVLSRDCSCICTGEHKGENLDKRNEYGAANVGEEEREDVSSESSGKNCHATVHIDCPLWMEILENRVVLLLAGVLHQATGGWYPFSLASVDSLASLAQCDCPLPALVPSVPSLSTTRSTALEIPLKSVPTFFYLWISPVGSHVFVDLGMLKRENSLDIELVAEVDRGEDGGELQEEDDPHQAGVHCQEDPVLRRCRHEPKDGEEEEHDANGDDEVGHGGKVVREKPEAGEKVEVDEDAAEVEHGSGGAEEQHIETPQQWLVDSHL